MRIGNSRLGCAFSLGIFLAILFSQGCAEAPPDVDQSRLQASPINSNTNFKALSYDDVTAILQNASNIYLEPVTRDDLESIGYSSADAKQQVSALEHPDDPSNSWYVLCRDQSGGADACLIVSQAFLPKFDDRFSWDFDALSAFPHLDSRQFYEALFIGCAASFPKAGRECFHLAEAFTSIGNYPAATAVLTSTYCARKRCWDGLGGVSKQARGSLYSADVHDPRLRSDLEQACKQSFDTYSCDFFSEMGGAYDRAAVIAGDEQRVKDQEKQAEQAAKERQQESSYDQQDEVPSAQDDQTQTPQTASNPTLDALKAYAAEHGGQIGNPYTQPRPSSNSRADNNDSHSAPTTENGDQSGADSPGPGCVTVKTDASGGWKVTSCYEGEQQVLLVQPAGNGATPQNVTVQFLNTGAWQIMGWNGNPYKVYACKGPNGPVDAGTGKEASYYSERVTCPAGGNSSGIH